VQYELDQEKNGSEAPVLRPVSDIFSCVFILAWSVNQGDFYEVQYELDQEKNGSEAPVLRPVSDIFSCVFILAWSVNQGDFYEVRMSWIRRRTEAKRPFFDQKMMTYSG
jgi:hypothetical protein